MLGQAERRHQLEHRHLDVARRLAAALAVEEGRHDGVGEVDARDLVGGNAGGIERGAVAHAQKLDSDANPVVHALDVAVDH